MAAYVYHSRERLQWNIVRRELRRFCYLLFNMWVMKISLSTLETTRFFIFRSQLSFIDRKQREYKTIDLFIAVYIECKLTRDFDGILCTSSLIIFLYFTPWQFDITTSVKKIVLYAQHKQVPVINVLKFFSQNLSPSFNRIFIFL